MDPSLEVIIGMLAGGATLMSHGLKAGTRLAINTSPEPFSNWTASFSEDVAVLGSIWMVFNHPIIMLILVIGFIGFVLWLIPKLFRLAKRGFYAMRDRMRGPKPTRPAATGSPQTG